MELQTVFPSATSSAVTSLATATWPNRHSIIGWDMYLDEVDSVATILRFERRHDGEPLSRLGVTEGQAYPVPSLFGGFAGVFFSVVPDGIANTPYSDYWGGHNTTYATYKDLTNGVDKVISLSRVGKAPSIVYFYAIDVDYAAHEHGTDAKQTMDALLRVDKAMSSAWR